MEVDVHVQGKKFEAKNQEQLDLILKYFKGWKSCERGFALPEKPC